MRPNNIARRACPHEALDLGRLGWRVLAGGRLGRHPALAVEAPGLFSDDEAVAGLARLLTFLMARYRPGERPAAAVPRDPMALGRLLRGESPAKAPSRPAGRPGRHRP